MSAAASMRRARVFSRLRSVRSAVGELVLGVMRLPTLPAQRWCGESQRSRFQYTFVSSMFSYRT